MYRRSPRRRRPAPRERLRGCAQAVGSRPHPPAPSRSRTHRAIHAGRARYRACGRTHVVIPARTYPRRPDTAETVGAALLAAVEGLGYRRVAERVEVPATTVRGWLQRARANSDTIRANATIAGHALATPWTLWPPRSTRPAVPWATWSKLSDWPSPLTSAGSDPSTRRGSSPWPSPAPGSSPLTPTNSPGTRQRDQPPTSTGPDTDLPQRSTSTKPTASSPTNVTPPSPSIRDGQQVPAVVQVPRSSRRRRLRSVVRQDIGALRSAACDTNSDRSERPLDHCTCRHLGRDQRQSALPACDQRFLTGEADSAGSCPQEALPRKRLL